jgi:AcrR family transcriptional regulator
MPRPTRQQIEDEILEAAATLFARHGFKETSIQRVADAVGYSKTGLLHRYPSKEALQQAVVDRAVAEVRAIVESVAPMPTGPERDRAVITQVARLALDRPGTVALLLSGITTDHGPGTGQHTVGEVVFAAFGIDPGCALETDPVRVVRVIGALGALAVASVALHDKLNPAALSALVEVAYDALGHRPA